MVSNEPATQLGHAFVHNINWVKLLVVVVQALEPLISKRAMKTETETDISPEELEEMSCKNITGPCNLFG